MAGTMASDSDFVEYITEQMRDAGEISCKKMFGEYGLYCGTKIIALICDNQLFVKPTESGRGFIGTVSEAPPYPGAKNYFLVENTDDREGLSELIRITASELPEPKPKKKRNSFSLII